MRIGIIGTGAMGKNHLRVVSSLPEFTLAAAMDLDAGTLQEACRPYDIKKHSDYRDMLDEVDAVMVAVPTRDHFNISRFFLENGKHVLVEKPITTTVEEAEILTRIAGDNHLTLAVGHLERFNPALETVSPLIRSPLFIEAQRLGPFSPRSLDIDVVLDLMIHDLDILLRLDPSGIKEIRAVGVPVISSNVDMASVRLEFHSGMVANVTASRVSQEKHRRLRVFQRSMYLSVDYKDQQVKVLQLQDREVIEQNPVVERAEPLKNLWLRFHRTVNESLPLSVSGEEAGQALELAIAVSNAIKKNGKA